MYKLTVIDLSTGKTEVDEEVNCIIGGAQVPSMEATKTMAIVSCSALEIAYAIESAETAIQHLLADHRIATAYALVKAVRSDIDKED